MNSEADLSGWRTVTEVVADLHNTSAFDNFKARYVSSAMGRFMTPDPLGNFVADPTVPQTWNMYSYVLNNPMRFVDPTGYDWCQWDDSSHDDSPDDGGATELVRRAGWNMDTDALPVRHYSVTAPQSPPLLDRLLHHGHILKCGPRSWRTKTHLPEQEKTG